MVAGTVVLSVQRPERLADVLGIVHRQHQVVTAYYWPVDEFSARLRRAGFTEVERRRRPGVSEPGRRPHAAIAAIAG